MAEGDMDSLILRGVAPDFGSGSGDGDREYWQSAISAFSQKWPVPQQTHFKALMARGVPIAYWRSNDNGASANGGKALVPAAPGVVHREKGPLGLCQVGTLHATYLPPKWKGERVWIVALHGTVIGDDEKMGCLEREILGECL